MIATLMIPMKLTASFSNRVAMRRHSLSHPMQHSMMCRRRYASRSNLRGTSTMMCLLVRTHRDDGAHAMEAKPVPNSRIAVALVARHRPRTLTRAATRLLDAHGIHQRFELRGFMALSGGDFDSEGQSRAVSNQMELGAESAARAAQRMVLGFARPPFSPAPAAARLARMLVPSTHHKSQSIRPSASRRICNASRIRSHVPSHNSSSSLLWLKEQNNINTSLSRVFRKSLGEVHHAANAAREIGADDGFHDVALDRVLAVGGFPHGFRKPAA